MQADYNNDGCKDILVLRGGWEVAQRKSLLRNNCNGTFTDVTVEAAWRRRRRARRRRSGPTSTTTASLDLFVGNEDTPAQLFLNNGTGHFEDIRAGAASIAPSFAKAVAAGDYDNDGYADLYVSNYDGPQLPLPQQPQQHVHRGRASRRASRCRAAASPPGSSTTTTTAGWICSSPAISSSVDETARTYLGCRTTRRR